MLNREGPTTFHGEGLVLPGRNGLGVEVTVGPALDALKARVASGRSALIISKTLNASDAEDVLK